MVWAVSLSTMDLITHSLTPGLGLMAFKVWLKLVGYYPPNSSRALPPLVNIRGCTSIHFGENQLSPGSFGISPLPTVHPITLQR